MRGLDLVFVYIDDIIIASNSYEQYIEHIEIVFKCSLDYGLRDNPDKCEFNQQRRKINYQHIAEAQTLDTELKELMNSTKSSLILKPIKIPDCEEELICDTPGKILRPFIPNSFRQTILETLHG